MAGRPTKLTPEVQSQIVALIRGGAFGHVAARAVGVSKSTYFDWLRRGEAAKGGKYVDFRDAVDKARAYARMGAEIEVRKMNPLAWLRLGPGRATFTEAGWTDLPSRLSQAQIDEIYQDVGTELGVAPRAVAGIIELLLDDVIKQSQWQFDW